jgi:hypothetical protein
MHVWWNSCREREGLDRIILRLRGTVKEILHFANRSLASMTGQSINQPQDAAASVPVE